MILKTFLFIYLIGILIGLVLVIEMPKHSNRASRTADWIALILWPVSVSISLLIYGLQQMKMIMERRKLSRVIRDVLRR